MAKKYDNSKYQNLKSQKSANEKKQESYKSEINDIEAELVSNLAIKAEIVEALVTSETRGSDNQHYIQAKNREINSLSENDLILKMRGSKASYAAYLSEIIEKYPRGEKEMKFVSPAILDVIKKLEDWV